jgi:methyl-accepting chemotaxis protein
MDFDQAIKLHVAWKTKLSAYVANPDRSLKAAEISVDDRCELGKWLHGEGMKYASLPEFAKLVADHARFHTAAADVVRKADAGRDVNPEIALGAKSSYAAASNAVVTALMRMKQAA